MKRIDYSMSKSAEEYAAEACGAIMKKYPAEELPTMDTFFYIGGVFLSGMQQLYLCTGEEKYFDYIKTWVDRYVYPDGTVLGHNRPYDTDSPTWMMRAVPKTFDHKQPAILLFDIWRKTGDERYKKAIYNIVTPVKAWPKNSAGGFYHMTFTKNQMWLDSIYMIGPLLAKYSNAFGEKWAAESAVEQIEIMYRYMQDENGLLRHGFDPSKESEWSDPETGLSPTVWGRAMGWFTVAALDILDEIMQDSKEAKRLAEIEREIMTRILKYRTENSLWCQVIDCPQRGGNFEEMSCSCLFIYSLYKGIRKGVLDRSWIRYADESYSAVIKKLRYDGEGNLVIGGICAGTCIDDGSYEHYIGRPLVENDLHGTGAFVLMCAERLRYDREFRTEGQAAYL
ncbi:MAG: glycoside hydrolase family 88 protein [Clostridia bacterium]|nr:glycoside hydrolase family 88 protein [Clostridia bacterium]